jgi:peptidyl-prolyl cis-trans isomerase SDCCAG10
MANEGKDSNGSQFFLTLGATPELQGKHTMFGRIEGDTIYNLMKMADAEMTEEDGSERPLYPTKISGAEVLVNPFEDMVVRVKEAPRTEEEGKKEVKKRKKPAGKNVLSFGGDEGEEDIVPVAKKAKANPKLVAKEEPEMEDDSTVPTVLKKKPNPTLSRSRTPSPSPRKIQEAKKLVPLPPPLQDPDESSESEPKEPSKRTTQLEKTNAEIAALKASMKRTIDNAPQETSKPKSALEAMIPASSTRGRKRGKATDEKGALDIFKAFKARLDDLPPTDEIEGGERPLQSQHAAENEQANGDDEEADLCDLHFIANCQSCKKWDEDDGEADDADDDTGWMSHQLTFAKDTLGKDLEWKRKMEEIEVIDPREKARTIKEERRKEKGEKDRARGKARA